MVTIYYPHFDLVSKGLLPQQNHVLNIKLLSLMCDQILVLPSHLLDISYSELVHLNNEISDFFHSGKIVTSIYQGQNGVGEYYLKKIDEANDTELKSAYQIKKDYVLCNLFEEPHIIFRDNEKEKGLFQIVFNEANILQATESNNAKLKHSVEIFKNEFYNRSERKGAYLTIKDVDEMTMDLIHEKCIYKTHRNFFLKNMIGSYYYCGSLANSAITAYNPYFINISYDDFSKSNPYGSSKIYSPEFLLNVLIGLKIFDTPADALRLSSEDIDEIKNHKAWNEFRNNYSSLCIYADDFQRAINLETDKQKRIDKIKRIVFGMAYGIADLPLSTIIGLILNGFWGTAIGILLISVEAFFNESKLYKRIQYSTTDAFIDRLIQSKEPLYVISNRIKHQIEKELI